MATELGLRTTARVVRRSMATEELGFKDFIRRAQVRAQFREMLRLARRYARARPAAGRPGRGLHMWARAPAIAREARPATWHTVAQPARQ